MLKLVAWMDRQHTTRRKDAADLCYLMKEYVRVEGVRDRLYDEGIMEAHDWVEEKASAQLLAMDMVTMASGQSRDYLCRSLFENAASLNLLAREMARSGGLEEECHSHVAIMTEVFLASDH